MTPVEWICFALLLALFALFLKTAFVYRRDGMMAACNTCLTCSGFFFTLAVGVLFS